VKVFNPPSDAGPSRLPASQPEDPKPTPSELKQAFASHIEQRNGPDAPLMTSAMREREAIKNGTQKKERVETRIRIRFSDRTMLEGTFSSTDKITVVYRFLREHLATQYKAKPFTLYQTPPKRDFPEQTKDPKMQGKTLKELGLVPQASLNIRWEDVSMNSNSFPAPLEPSLKGKAENLPAPKSFEESSGSKSSGKSDGDKKIFPKWLKGLSKK
ncbi:uncharacterized protein FA14DRAFT_113176, partial [Meira miltonrushii]